MKVSFQLDEKGLPIDCQPSVRGDANSLVEEVCFFLYDLSQTKLSPKQFMLLANMSVARVIASGLPEQSLLRRHEPPIERRIVSLPIFAELAERM